MLECITFIITLIFGYITKRNPKIKNYIIPLQNFTIGFMIALIDFIVTKDFNASIVASGILAGGTYDIFHNLKLIINEKMNNKNKKA